MALGVGVGVSGQARRKMSHASILLRSGRREKKVFLQSKLLDQIYPFIAETTKKCNRVAFYVPSVCMLVEFMVFSPSCFYRYLGFFSILHSAT